MGVSYAISAIATSVLLVLLMRVVLQMPMLLLWPPNQPVQRQLLRERLDLCHVGFWLRIGSACLPNDDRLPAMADVIFELQMADGGWNCKIRNYPNTTHSSFHTTFNVLEGLRETVQNGIIDAQRFKVAEDRALEFMLEHRLSVHHES